MSKIKDLSLMLEESLKVLNIPKIKFGNINTIITTEKEISRYAQNIRHNFNNSTNRPDLAILVNKFLANNYTDFTFREFNKLSSCINDITPKKTSIATDTQKLTKLLDIYQQQINDESLHKLVWNRILSSYFAFTIIENDEQNLENLELIRKFLVNSYHLYTNHTKLSPWLKILKQNLTLLHKNPCDNFAKDILQGSNTKIDEIKKYSSVMPSSWFWSKLVVAVANSACELNDAEFKNKLDYIINMLNTNSIFKNEVIIILLTRYYKCTSHAIDKNENFKDYLISKEVWGNPKLKMLKTVSNSNNWNRVEENIWKMVLKWVTSSNLKDFFELIASKDGADIERMQFWQQYIEQISWSKLIFGTNTLASINKDIKRLIASEEGVSANLQGNPNSDAFILQIADFYIVEFSITSNAAYVYKKEHIYFDLYAKELSDGTGKKELKSGHNYERELKIQHNLNWQYNTKQKLANLGIYPDTVNNKNLKKLDKLNKIIQWAKDNNIKYSDNRNSTGKLWIYHKYRSDKLALSLKANGFLYTEHMQAWYWENK